MATGCFRKRHRWTQRCGFFSAALVGVSLALQGCGGGGGGDGPSPSPAPASSIEGFYVDKQHYRDGSLAGSRMISERRGGNLTETITVIGTDDGSQFWAVKGAWDSRKNGEFTVDFSPKGGPTIKGAHEAGVIKWEDGNTWTVSTKLPAGAKPAAIAVEDLGGFYADPNHAKAGSFAGYRFISDIRDVVVGPSISLIGSDDGQVFWTLNGTVLNRVAGNITVDFSPKGGPANLKGTFTGTNITWQDGNVWTMQDVTPTSSIVM